MDGKGQWCSTTVFEFFKSFREAPPKKKLKLPRRFVRHHGETLSNAVFLKLPCGSEWEIGLMKSDGRVWLNQGWPEFTTHYSLDQRRLLFFRYKGNYRFAVSIFGKTTCQICYDPVPARSVEPDIDEDNIRTGFDNPVLISNRLSLSIKLNNSNFLLWKSQISPLIRNLGIFHHIGSSEKPLEEILDTSGKKVTNEEYSTWCNNDGLLIAWLLSNMTGEVFSIIYCADTAHQIWHSLGEQLLPNTEESEAQLKTSLYALSKGSLSLDEHIRKFKSIWDKLAAMGKPLSNLDKIFEISRGLGKKYRDFKLAVLSKPPYPTFMI